MNRFTRVLAGALAAVLAAGSLAACGEKKRKLPEKQVLDHVYKYETKTLATYDEVKWDEDAQKDFKGYTVVQDTVLSPAGYAYRTVTVDKDYNTTAQSVSFGRFDGSDPVTVDTGLPTGSGDAVYFSATAVVPQGLAAVMDENRVIGEQKVDGETVPIYEQKTYLRIYGFDGAKLSETEITPALFGLADTGANGYFGVDRVITDGKDLYMTLRSDNTRRRASSFISARTAARRSRSPLRTAGTITSSRSISSARANCLRPTMTISAAARRRLFWMSRPARRPRWKETPSPAAMRCSTIPSAVRTACICLTAPSACTSWIPTR